jgi:RNA polymerase sigma factor (sigma-70 family)
MDGFDSLYKRHFKEIVRFLDAITKNRHYSEELAQEAFYKVLKKNPTITKSFVAYMKTTALNVFRNQRRADHRLKYGVLDSDWVYENHIINEIFIREQADKLMEIVSLLPGRQRETMILFLSGHSIKEIAEELDQPYDTAKANIRHVTEKIKSSKEFLKNAFGSEDLTEKRLSL